MGLRDAVARGDIYGSLLMSTGPACIAWLAADRPDFAEQQVNATVAKWSTQRFDSAHYSGLLARVHVVLYRGDAVKADVLVRELRERARASSLWRVQSIRLFILQLSAATALLLVERGLGERGALLRSAASDARAIERERVPTAQPFATLTRAGIALRSGERAEATRGLEAAARELEAVGVVAYAAAARDRAARLRDDASTAAEVEQVAAYFRAEDVVVPERMIEVLVPGFRAS